jgi:hypothetical protein
MEVELEVEMFVVVVTLLVIVVTTVPEDVVVLLPLSVELGGVVFDAVEKVDVVVFVDIEVVEVDVEEFDVDVVFDVEVVEVGVEVEVLVEVLFRV